MERNEIEDWITKHHTSCFNHAVAARAALDGAPPVVVCALAADEEAWKLHCDLKCRLDALIYEIASVVRVFNDGE